METFQQAVEFLYSFINYERLSTVKYGPDTYNLDSFRRLLNRLGNPHEDLPAVHIAGTKGKGTTAAMLASVLSRAGLKTGLYTSPHLVDIRERIRVAGKKISIDDFISNVDFLSKMITDPEIPVGGGYRTTFELLTALAFMVFKKEKVDCAVLETGMGGRLDCTNVINPVVSVLTPVSMDHVESLGTDLRQIAGEKAGIIKAGADALTSRQSREVMDVFADTGRRLGVSITPVNSLFSATAIRLAPDGSRFALKRKSGDRQELFIPFAGRHFVDNALTAVAAAELFALRMGRTINSQHIREGLAGTKWPGRMTVLKSPFDASGERDVRFIVDGAHNVAAVERLVETIKTIVDDRPVWVIFAAPSNKQVEDMIGPLAAIARQFIVTRYDNPRASSLDSLLSLAGRYHSSVQPAEGLYDALKKIEKIPVKRFDVLICGSLYLAGEALRMLGYTDDN